MIYDLLVRFGKSHPNIMRGLVGTAAFVIFGYIALSMVSGEIVEGNRIVCQRANERAVAEYREKEGLIQGEQRKQAESERDGHTARAKGSEEIIEAYEGKQDALVRVARGSGHQMTKESVTINCTEEWPKPLTIGGS